MKYLLSIFGVLAGSLLISVPRAHAALGGIFNIGSCGNIDNPGKTELICVAQNILGMLMKTVGAIVVVMIIISGIMYMTSMGNPNQVALAKKTLVGSIIGLIIVVTAYGAVALLVSLFTS